jgi:RNA polymerase sigma-70 factor (ECF subfamily)
MAAASRSDAELVAEARRDPEAFAALFDRYWDPIFGFCYLRLGDWHEAEDVASQVFLNTLTSLPRFESRGTEDTFRAWLFGIARNLVGTSHRHRSTHKKEPIELAAGAIDAKNAPDELAVAAEEHEQLLWLMNQLAPDQRELLELRLAGLSAVEIGRVLGRTPEAVRKAQSRTTSDSPSIGMPLWPASRTRSTSNSRSPTRSATLTPFLRRPSRDRLASEPGSASLLPILDLRSPTCLHLFYNHRW